jgi:hypothetical protein
MHQDARKTRNLKASLQARRIDTRISEMVPCFEFWAVEKLASQTALRRQWTRALQTSAWPWLRAR